MTGTVIGEETTTSSGTRRYCNACDEEVLGGEFLWNKHVAMNRHVKAVAAKSGQRCPGFPCAKCGKMFIT